MCLHHVPDGMLIRKFPSRPLLVLLLCLPLHCPAGGEPEPETPPAAGALPTVNWTSLRYAADRFGVSLSTTLRLAASSRQEMQGPRFAALGNEPFQTATGGVLRLDIQAHAETAFDSYDTQGEVWFASGGLATLQRERLKPGVDGSRKIYRFGPEGAFRIRLEPNGREEGRQDPLAWTRLKRNFYPYDLAAAGCRVATTPELLLYLASTPDPVNGGAPHCVFVDDALYRVWLVPGGEAPRPVDYVVKTGDEAHRLDGARKTLKLALRVEPVSPGADPAAFELLELRGAIAIYLDTGTRLPVLITGERAGAGELGVGLVEAVMRE
jgi:hypothetical protein